MLFIVIYKCKYSDMNNKISCEWKPLSSSYDESRRIVCNQYIRYINKLNINYFIGFGSALGAIRNKGLIKNDADIDIIVPIINNEHIFKCNEKIYISNYLYQNKSVLLNRNIHLCNHSRMYYSKLLYNYVVERSINLKIKLIKTRFIEDLVMAFYISKDLYVDMYPVIANEWVYRDYGICKCKFCESITYCNTKVNETSKILYGDDYLTPKRKKSKLKTVRINKYK